VVDCGGLYLANGQCTDTVGLGSRSIETNLILAVAKPAATSGRLLTCICIMATDSVDTGKTAPMVVLALFRFRSTVSAVSVEQM